MHYSHFNFTDSFQLHVVQLSLPWYLRLCCHFMPFKIFMTSLSSEYNLLFSFGHPLNTIAKSLCRISLVKLNKDVLKVNTNLANRLLRQQRPIYFMFPCQGQQFNCNKQKTLGKFGKIESHCIPRQIFS